VKLCGYKLRERRNSSDLSLSRRKLGISADILAGGEPGPRKARLSDYHQSELLSKGVGKSVVGKRYRVWGVKVPSLGSLFVEGSKGSKVIDICRVWVKVFKDPVRPPIAKIREPGTIDSHCEPGKDIPPIILFQKEDHRPAKCAL
jgi:hypothetical protein